MRTYLAGPTTTFQIQFFTIKQKNPPSDLLISENRGLKIISETKVRTRPTRSDAVVLGTLLQATRGILLIVFNWTLFVHFDQIRSIPGLDVMAVLPPSIYYLIGFMDIFMVRWMWRRSLNGWRYGITMSILIIFLNPVTLWMLPFSRLYSTFLFIIIDLFTTAEIIALITPDACRYYRT